ncbi:hypothetical protein ACXR0O_00070 [Verrucomicrobiota bacterium sgz303538]
MTVLFVFTIGEPMGGEVLAASTLRRLQVRATLALRHLASEAANLIAQGLSVSHEVFCISREGLDTSFQGFYTSREGFYLIDEVLTLVRQGFTLVHEVQSLVNEG